MPHSLSVMTNCYTLNIRVVVEHGGSGYKKAFFFFFLA